MPLPLTVSCSSKIQIGFTFLVPAHLGSPGQWAVKRVCVCVCVCVRARCINCLLVYIVCFPTYPFSSLFLYLSFPLRMDPLRFQAGCCKRRLNLALAFCVYFVL